MKVIEAINAVNALNKIKLNKIKNDKVKFTLVADYTILRRIGRAFEADREELTRKFQDELGDEVQAVQKLREEGKPITGHDDYLQAEKDHIKQLDALLKAEAQPEGLCTVTLADFLKSAGDTELAFEDIVNLQDIVIKD